MLCDSLVGCAHDTSHDGEINVIAFANGSGKCREFSGQVWTIEIKIGKGLDNTQIGYYSYPYDAKEN